MVYRYVVVAAVPYTYIDYEWVENFYGIDIGIKMSACRCRPYTGPHVPPQTTHDGQQRVTVPRPLNIRVIAEICKICAFLDTRRAINCSMGRRRSAAMVEYALLL